MNTLPLKSASIEEVQVEFDKYYRNYMELRPEPGYSILHHVELTPLFTKVVEQLGLGKPIAVLFTRTERGVDVHEHIDQDAVGDPRWHLPIYTLETLFIEDGIVHSMREGFWYGPIRYWLPHSVINNGAGERVHLVVDFEDLSSMEGG